MPDDLEPQLPAGRFTGLEPMLSSAVSVGDRIAQMQAALDEHPGGTAGWSAAVPLLAKALAGRDSKAACAAAEVLGRLGEAAEGAIAALVRAALRRRLTGRASGRRTGIAEVADCAADALCRIGEPAVLALIEALGGPEAEPVLKPPNCSGISAQRPRPPFRH